MITYYSLFSIHVIDHVTCGHLDLPCWKTTFDQVRVVIVGAQFVRSTSRVSFDRPHQSWLIFVQFMLKSSFYRLSKTIEHQGEDALKLSEERRTKWLSRISREDLKDDPQKLKLIRVCLDHFVSGKYTRVI